MTRDLLCPKCGGKTKLHPEDIQNGLCERKVELRVKVPNQHGLAINGTFWPIKGLACDSCGEPIAEGSIAVARTVWRTSIEGEPEMWEHELLAKEPK